MSRSIGDFVAHSVGVIETPEVKEYQLNLDDQIIIIASDGVWEFMSNQVVAEIAFEQYPLL